MGNSESKSKFRSSLYKLNNEEIPARHQHDFWNSLFAVKTTSEEIFTLIQPEEVRVLRKNQPSNLNTMMAKAIAQIESIAQNPVSKYFPQVLTCVRVLIRLLPVVLAEPSSESFFWGSSDGDDSAREKPGETPQPSINTPSRDVKSLGTRLITSVFQLLFLPAFTVTENSTEDNSSLGFNPTLLWTSGVAYTEEISTTSSSTIEKNRKEVLTLLLVCCSSVLYHKVENYNSDAVDAFLELATTDGDDISKTRHHTLCYSLLNTILKWDPVGYWRIPYSAAISVSTDTTGALAARSLQVLLVLLDYKNTSSSSSDSNLYVNCLSNLRSCEDFEVIYTGICRLLNIAPESQRTILPSSMPEVSCHPELLVLLWKLLEMNSNFLSYVAAKEDCHDALLVPLLYFIGEGREDPSKVGMIHICTFILLRLSSERSFCVSLNALLPMSKLPITGLPPCNEAVCSAADALIVVLHLVIVSGHQKLNSVYNSFLTILANVSPFCKKLGAISAVRLVRLFKLFASPSYVFANEANHHLLTFLLDVFNNILQYQYDGNHHLVYAIVESQEVFTSLLKLEFTDKCNFSDEWMASWKQSLSLETTTRLLAALKPKLVSLQESTELGALSESDVIDFIRQTTMVGLLPVPHPIVIRSYQSNIYTNFWITTFVWSVIFLNCQTMFDGKDVRLFTIDNHNNNESQL